MFSPSTTLSSNENVPSEFNVTAVPSIVSVADGSVFPTRRNVPICTFSVFPFSSKINTGGVISAFTLNVAMYLTSSSLKQYSVRIVFSPSASEREKLPLPVSNSLFEVSPKMISAVTLCFAS